MRQLILFFAFVFPAVQTFAEETALTAAEARQVLPGSTIRWIRANGSPRSVTFNSDGTIEGILNPRARARKENHSSSGVWTVTEEGMVCVTEEWALDRGGEKHWCANLRRNPNEGSLQLFHRRATPVAAEATSTTE